MRLPGIFLCLMLCAALIGCAQTPWYKSGVTDDKVAAGMFNVDSSDCDLEARDAHPINQDGQIKVYNACMEKKGWAKRDGTKTVNFR